jgi:DNA-binding PadR family transcriptional regulator
MPKDPSPSPLSVAVLGLLSGGPLHPYRMQRLLKEWGKDQVINVGQRSSLYKTIKRLHDGGLISIRETERDQAYPERTVYELEPEGRRLLLRWLDQMLSTPRNEFPQFPAALSFAMLLGPEGARSALARRAESLQQGLEALDADLARHAGELPRVTLLESEYQRAMTAAELAWLTAIVDGLRAKTLNWGEADFADADQAYLPDEPAGV